MYCSLLSSSRDLIHRRLMTAFWRERDIQLRARERVLLPDIVEKVEKSSVTKTRQIVIRWNIAAQHHLRPVQDLVRCAIDKLAGPPADFLNAAPVGLPENRTLPKGSFSTVSPQDA